jgi:hypothetical protein
MNDADAAPTQAACEGIVDEGREDEWGKETVSWTRVTDPLS